ncbi:exosome complex component RRP46 [Condylostylus longicornis]|uniref:exosome complex component RRP46 n=1 Tax=Condylostylus longicornis TaxID=2530218 RepID=UPI00244E0B22|nr:exosome complex component RRP46 [Condylostylus longicornis]
MKIENSSTDSGFELKLRPLQCELKPLTRADGSAFLSQGETTVLASMYGPIEARQHNTKVDKATVDVTFRPKIGLPGVKDRFRESIVKSICETAILTTLHPRTAITIQIQELDDRCGIEACAVNAACLSLIIGGIDMKFTIAALHCIIDKNEVLLLDPDQKQASGALASFTFVFDSIHKNLIAANTYGKFSLRQYNDAQLMCKAASEYLFKFYVDIIKKSLSYKMEASEEL